MSERADRIGGWISLMLFSVWLLIGSLAQGARAQAPQSAQTPPAVAPPDNLFLDLASLIGKIAHAIDCDLYKLWPGEAPIFGAIIAGFAAWAIAHFYTKRLKRVEATLEFSKRFHELIQRQCVLNRRYEEDRIKPGYNPNLDRTDADAWWWQLFDLLLYEYDFYQSRLVGTGRFEEWMVWRWHDYHPKPGEEWKTCGVDYKSAWDRWKKHPAHGSRLIGLVDEIHGIAVVRTPQMTDQDYDKLIANEVRKRIKPHGPRWWRGTDLDAGRL